MNDVMETHSSFSAAILHMKVLEVKLEIEHNTTREFKPPTSTSSLP